MNRGKIAADIHKKMCNDSRFGYSWAERYGATQERWTVGGVSFDIGVGDYDCSSSTITAWKKALSDTPYKNALDGATYTGNMKDIFLKSGLFEWKPMSFLAEPGDLYLNISNHVAMCQTQYPDILSEFSSNEHGGAYGGQRGDQTGWESHITNYYDYPWNGILHYNGKADTKKEEDMPLTQAEINKIADAVWAKKIQNVPAQDRLYGMDAIQLPGMPEKVWAFKIKDVQARDRLYGIDAIQLPAVLAAVNALSKYNGNNAEQVAKEVQKAVKEALEKIELNVKVGK